MNCTVLKLASSTALMALLAAVSVPAHAGTYGGGNGTPDSPYLIETAAHLQELGTTPTDWNKDFTFVADIDLKEETVEVIGSPSTPFSGTLDGKGHTLSNLTQERPDGEQIGGLFGVIGADGTVLDLAVVAATVSGYRYVGGLAGRNNGTISGCCVIGNVAVTTDYVGGLVGMNYGKISRCYATGSVSGTGCVGGLVAEAEHSTARIDTCHASGNVSGEWAVGGLVGFNIVGTVSGCFASGTVAGSGSGSITGIGGLVGFSSNGVVSNCFANGNVSGQWAVGGLIGGYSGGNVSCCYACGGVAGTRSAGGLAGFNDGGTVSASFWDQEASGQTTSAGGTGENTANMMKAATFTAAGWDFNTPAWMIMEDEDYPRLAALVSWQPDIAVYPLALDFGDVQVGDTVTALVTIVSEGAGPLGLGRILLNGDPAFSDTSPAPGTLEPGEGEGIVISFTPSAPGSTMADLTIESGDAEEPIVTVSLQGFGSLARLPPGEQCEAIIACANAWIEAGSLVGAGPGNPASHGKRLQALLKRLDAINDLLHKGWNERAFQQLSALYKEMDGSPSPPDFVSGDKAADLAHLFLDLMASIGVEEQTRPRGL